MTPKVLKENRTASLKPPLKWAGGKRWLVPHIRPLWENHRERRLVEPLCGGLAITLNLLPRRSLLNDINPHLVNFYRWLKRGLEIDLHMQNKEAPYYAARERFNDLIENGGARSAETAGLFYYLNRTGYNGLCRFNNSGLFNVPFGRYTRINYRRDFTPYRKVFRDWKFASDDFEKLDLDSADFIYADPPYDVEFTKYAKQDFDWDDQVRLAKWLAKHPGPVALSNQATQRIVELYGNLGFQMNYLDGPRRISCTGDRSPAKEVLALRNLPDVT